jgi:hypothetical protein
MKLYKALAVSFLMASSMALTALPASALEESASSSMTKVGESTTTGTVKVGDREFGPSDGVTTTTESFEITPGTGSTVGVNWASTPKKGQVGTLATWGQSYATSTEYVQFFYRGAAKAAANVYYNERIVQVCIQYTRNGVGVADRRCSIASSNGSSWYAGPEVLSYAADDVGTYAPRTVFNISTTRINPNVY